MKLTLCVTKIINTILLCVYNWEFQRKLIGVADVCSGKDYKHLEEGDIPEYDEQKKIGSYFSTLDHLSILYQRKLKMLKNIKNLCLKNVCLGERYIWKKLYYFMEVLIRK